MKTGIRLTKIDKMITQHYDEIWDCCCDHGLLGLTLLKRKAANVVHFVDVVEPLMIKLESTLQQFFSGDDFQNNWQVHCLDVAKLPLTTGSKKVVVIAGVGGELLIELMTAIMTNYQSAQRLNNDMNQVIYQDEIEFILCPVHHHYKVRQALIKFNCHLVDECLITENKRFYEIIHVAVMFDVNGNILDKKSMNHKDVKSVSPVGSLMWDFSDKTHQQYLAKTIKHYQRMLNKTETEAVEIIAAYQGLTV